MKPEIIFNFTEMSAFLRRIDLSTKLLAPVLAGQVCASNLILQAARKSAFVAIFTSFLISFKTIDNI